MRASVSFLLVVSACFVVVFGHQTQVTEENDSEQPLPHDHRFFLQQIFDKYGHRGIMTFEGFEHLLESLGLGRLSFEKNHNVSLHRVNGTFHEVHDSLDLHRHDHSNELTEQRAKRSPELDNESELEELVDEHQEDVTSDYLASSHMRRCMSPQDILVTYGLQPHHGLVISPLSFLHLCPAIVYELDQRSCYTVDQQDYEQENSLHHSAWLYASLSVLAISVTGLLGVAVVPLVQKSFYQQLLQFLVALAVGTLCGDALLHLLPHALMSSSVHDGHTTPVLRAAVTFMALTFFFLLETILQRVNIMAAKTKSIDDQLSESTNQQHRDMSNAERGAMLDPSEAKVHHGHQHNAPEDGAVSSVAWMVIMGDGLHNLTDGLAIGAAFTGDPVAGFATALAVFCHELPHELGDFAVLLQSGMSVRHALLYNIFSSILSFLGMAVGVWLGDYEEASLWIYAATAGTFLYIALADLIPEMNRYSEGSQSIVDITLQIAGILTGGGIMLSIALYEDSLHSIFN